MHFRTRYGQTGPGGGSLPAFVERTGSIAPFNPLYARNDILPDNVEMRTRIPVGLSPGYVPGGGSAPSVLPDAESANMFYVGQGHGHGQGRGLGAFPHLPHLQHRAAPSRGMPGAVSQAVAAVISVPEPGSSDAAFSSKIANAMRASAQLAKIHGAPASVMGPAVAHLMSGQPVILRWGNGVETKIAP